MTVTQKRDYDDDETTVMERLVDDNDKTTMMI
jgi:hypothetical protein